MAVVPKEGSPAASAALTKRTSSVCVTGRVGVGLWLRPILAKGLTAGILSP
jgi:hypothetical protein